MLLLDLDALLPLYHQKCLRTCRCDNYFCGFTWLRINDGIADVPKMSFYFFVEDFIVTDGRLQKRIPVDKSLSATDKPLFEKAKEGFAYGFSHCGQV